MTRIILLLCWVVAGLFAAAGFAKFLDLAEFESQLAGWSLFENKSLRAAAVLGVPLIEIATFGLFACLPGKRRLAALVMIGLLAVFSVGYLVEANLAGDPDCACFGLLARHFAFQQDARWVIGRNLLLALPPVFLLVWGRRFPRSVPASFPEVRGARGFSLVELLVVIAVVAGVLAILFPALRHARRAGRESASLNNLRQHAGVFLTYGQDHREMFPYFTVPLPGPSSPIEMPDGRVRRMGYFSAFYMWPYALSRGYYGGNVGQGCFRTPFRAEIPQGSFDYLYPCVFIADPTYWRYETRMLPPSQLRAVRWGEVGYPSAKVLISDVGVSEASGRRQGAAGCVDGHAEIVARSRMTRQYPTGDAIDGFEYGRHAGFQHDFMHTFGGVAERDFTPPLAK